MLYYRLSPPYLDLRAPALALLSLYDSPARNSFDCKDYDRATAYMGSNLRRRDPLQIGDGSPELSSAVVKINEAVISNIAQQQKLMSCTIWLAGVFP